jgi:hypothetical protein
MMEVARLVRTGLLVGLVGVLIHLTSPVVSPIVPFVVIGLLYCLLHLPGGAGPERTPPLFDEQTLPCGLSFGVAAVQGGRPYMEDMYQVVSFNASNGTGSGSGGGSGAGLNNTVIQSAAAESLGLANFFAVYDGHGGKLAAQYVHKNLVSRIVAALELNVSAGSESIGSEAASAGALDAVISKSLREGFLQADEAFIRVGRAACSARGAG